MYFLGVRRRLRCSAEQNVLQTTGCGVVHCASSNFMLKSGVLDVRPLLAQGIKVALGTDLAGGCSPSVLDALRQVKNEKNKRMNGRASRASGFYRC